jgi:hypothetical protein
MRLNFNNYWTIATIFLCFSNISSAASVISCGTGTYDYGDADVSHNGTQYGEACHDTNRWQQLGGSGRDNPLEGDSGNASNTENKGWSDEQSQNNTDTGDNGVKWRVQNLDGSWPEKYSRGELTAGVNVQFRFTVKRSNEGNHEFDQLKAWSDWNGNGIFEDSENLIDEKWYKNRNTNDDLVANSGNSNSNLGTDNNKDTWRKYYSSKDITVPVNAVIGDTWMRARIICENSLVAENDFTLSSIGYYHQGEVEDYKVAINQVPEPTTLLVFGSALIGLLLNRKKMP